MTREQTLIAREGYTRAMFDIGYSEPRAREMAKAAFPSPKIAVPREVKAAEDRVTYRYVAGQFESRHRNEEDWRRSYIFNVLSPKEINDVLGLINNPTHEVEVDA